MREYISALRAIWSAWNTGERLDFRGDFYSHTLMTPFFSPGPNPWGPPKVYLAAVGEHMTRVAGEVCDGIIPHPLTTAALPAGARRSRCSRRGSRRAVARWPTSRSASQAFVVTGRTEEEMADRRRRRAASDRVLRQYARLPVGARDARLGRSRRGAQPALPRHRGRPVGAHGRADRRRRARRVRGGGRAGRARALRWSSATPTSWTASPSTRPTNSTRRCSPRPSRS